MEYYAGIDVSLEESSVCVVDAAGEVVGEAKVASEPAALIAWFEARGDEVCRVGLEAGPLSQWLYAGMAEAGLGVELLETRHVRAAFKTMPVKTDRKDAWGIAQLMRLGWFRPVHCKSLSAQEVRALLTVRKLVQCKRHDVEMSLRGVLRGFGLKVGKTTAGRFEARVRDLAAGHPVLETVTGALLAARCVLVRELQVLEKRVRSMAREDARTRLLMDGPGGGCDRGSAALQVVEDGGGPFRPDPEEVSVGGEGRHGADLQDRRPGRAHGPLWGRPRHSGAAGEGGVSQALGDGSGQARR